MTSLYFQEIRATQAPFSFGVDAQNREMFSCNYIVRAVSPAPRMEDGIESILRAADIVADDEMIYIGPHATRPDTDGSIPFFTLVATSGYEPDETHDTKRENLGLQIITTADYEVARDRSYLIYQYLDGLRSVSVTL